NYFSLFSGVFCFFLVSCSFCYASECQKNIYFKDAGPLVETSTGSIVGKYVKVFDTDVASFLGIPFAEPPVADKRFLKTDPIAPWDGLLKATKMPPPCIQYSSRNFGWIPASEASENCLFLNIWTPVACCSNPSGRFPVLVWIYGGGFYSGSTDIDAYDGSIMASYGNAIIVSINYRVGIFGFLNDGTDDAPGNSGMHDQLLALKWIQKNIQYFGGDPQSITLFGESAGSMSIGLHMISPMSKDLFHRAILQSGAPYNLAVTDSRAIAQFKLKAFGEAVGCISDSSTEEYSASQVLACIKSKDSLELAKAENNFTSKFPSFFIPTHGDEFLPKSPVEMLESGSFQDVDVLIGNNQNEGSVFLSYIIPELFPLDAKPPVSKEIAEKIVIKLFEKIPNFPADEIFQYYFQHIPEEDTDAIVKAIADSFGDFVFVCPTLFFAEKIKNVYAYWNTHRSLRSNFADWLGVTHFDEVPFVFGEPILDTYNYTPEDSRYSADLIRKWVSFARSGNPLGEEGSKLNWPKFTAENPQVLVLNPRLSTNTTFPRLSQCEFWRPFFTQLLRNSTVSG
ncbi:acetylcholinesterase-like, partial [Stegodyphus dumicola]|uniref:acetylcholinesterase-like n=1 Tax=Stegodyphus dumicola TaxID=202533 RepID=UPI0015A7AE10